MSNWCLDSVLTADSCRFQSLLNSFLYRSRFKLPFQLFLLSPWFFSFFFFHVLSHSWKKMSFLGLHCPLALFLFILFRRTRRIYHILVVFSFINAFLKKKGKEGKKFCESRENWATVCIECLMKLTRLHSPFLPLSFSSDSPLIAEWDPWDSGDDSPQHTNLLSLTLPNTGVL